MGDRLDFKGLARELLSNIDGILASWLPGGRREGNEYVVQNPTRGDSKKGSFKINVRGGKAGKWSDFATGDRGGDLISLYQYLFGVDAKKAYQDLRGPSAKIDYAKNKDNIKLPEFEEEVEQLDIPDDAPEMPQPKGRALEAEYVDPDTGEGLYPVTIYKDLRGKTIYRTVTRRNKTTGGKYAIPTSWCRWKREQQVWDDSKKEYVGTGKVIDTVGWNNKDVPRRPLCGLNYLFERIEAPVLVCEGEKTWASLIARLPEYSAITWRGGTNTVDLADWEVITGRNVIICPDYDLVGQKAALKIANILKRQDNNVRICWEPLSSNSHPEHWDLADEKDVDKIRQYLRDTAVFLSNVEALIEEENAKEESETDIIMPEYNRLLSSISGQMLNDQKELRCLGYGADNKNYFISRKRGIVVAMTPDQLGNVNQVMSLMPLPFWYKLFPTERSGINKHEMGNALQRWADEKGMFNPDVIRGAGVWLEKDGRHVLHLGQKLLVENKLVNINEFPSEYMYEATSDLGVRQVKPLAIAEAKKFLELCEWLSWESPVSAKQLAGFAVVAPMCGGLEWRPHIWLTGSAGSGKSTVLRKILKAACGKMSLFVQGDSTAAGIRQRLGSDALPVIFDEFEGENPKRLDELQKTLDLARQASSENGALMLKGSATGDAVEFKIRSCFAFSSINVNLMHYADASRTTVLTLKPAPKGLSEDEKSERIKNYQAFEARIKEVLTPDFVNALQMRTFALLSVIKENARIFGAAIERIRNSPRDGDQLGILSAGAYSLEHSDIVSAKDAEEWVKAQDWEKSTASGDDKDHDRCLSYMMQWILRIQGDGKYLEYSVGELIGAVIDRKPWCDEADAVLKRCGFKVDRTKKVLAIANTHTKLSEIMMKSPYHSWSRLLLRCEGAKPSANSVKFSTGTGSRAVLLPFDSLVNMDKDLEY